MKSLKKSLMNEGHYTPTMLKEWRNMFFDWDHIGPDDIAELLDELFFATYNQDLKETLEKIK